MVKDRPRYATHLGTSGLPKALSTVLRLAAIHDVVFGVCSAEYRVLAQALAQLLCSFAAIISVRLATRRATCPANPEQPMGGKAPCEDHVHPIPSRASPSVRFVRLPHAAGPVRHRD